MGWYLYVADIWCSLRECTSSSSSCSRSSQYPQPKLHAFLESRTTAPHFKTSLLHFAESIHCGHLIGRSISTLAHQCHQPINTLGPSYTIVLSNLNNRCHLQGFECWNRDYFTGERRRHTMVGSSMLVQPQLVQRRGRSLAPASLNNVTMISLASPNDDCDGSHPHPKPCLTTPHQRAITGKYPFFIYLLLLFL